MLRRLVGEGAVSAAFIPAFSRYLAEDKKREAWEFTNRLLTLITIGLTVIVILGIVLSPLLVRFLAWGFIGTPGKLELTAALNRIMFPYIMLISLSALAMGVLNSFHRFSAPAFAPVLLNISVIAFSFMTPLFNAPEVALAIGVVAGGILQLAIQIPPIVKEGWRPQFRLDLSHPGIRRVGKLMVPVVFGVGIVQVNTLVSSQFASFLEEGSVTALYISDRVMELVLGGYSIALATAILPLMSRQAASRQMTELKDTLNFSTRLVLFITLPSTVGLIVLREPIIEVLFQRGEFDAASTALTAWPLLFYGIGLSAFSMVKIIVPAFYALQDTRTPAMIAFISMLLNIVFNFIFLGPLQQGGPAFATSLAGYFDSGALMVIFYRRYGSFEVSGILNSCAKFAIGSAAMGLVAGVLIHIPGFYAGQPAFQKVLALAGTIAAAGGTYFALTVMLRSRELRELRDVFRKRPSSVVVTGE
jgi:putative peptidoglycan lipid II flippase